MNIKKNLSLLLLLSAFAFSCLIITASGFPYLGLGISFAILASLIYFSRAQHSFFDSAIYMKILLLSACIFITSNEFQTFLNIAAVLWLGAFFVKSDYEKNRFSFFTFALSPITSFFTALRTRSEFTFSPKVAFKGRTYLRNGSLLVVFTSLLITIIVLIVVVPLLASANPIFARLITTYIPIEKILEWLIPKSYIIWIPRAIFFVVLAFYLPRLFTYALGTQEIENRNLFSVDTFYLVLPKVVVSLVLLVFFVTQIQLYSSSPQTLVEMGYTLSRYAREVFAQLTVVSIIIMILLYNEGSTSRWSRRLTYVLLAQVFFLVLMAFKSVFDYSNSWGLTEKRLWGFTGIFWIIPVLSFYSYCYYKRLENQVFVRGVILFSAATLLFVNLLNFDYLVYHFKKSTTESGIDYSYLSQLSPDSLAYAELWKDLRDEKNNVANMYYIAPRENLRYKIENLQFKYGHFDLRSFNFYEYVQFLQIKSIDVKSVPISSYPNNPPSQVPSTLVTAQSGPVKLQSKYGYMLEVPGNWRVLSKENNLYEQQLFRCEEDLSSCENYPDKQLGLLTIMNKNAANQESDMMSVQDYVKTTQIEFWWNPATKHVEPFKDEVFASGIIARSRPNSPGALDFYIPNPRGVIIGSFFFLRDLPAHEEKAVSDEVHTILESYTYK